MPSTQKFTIDLLLNTLYPRIYVFIRKSIHSKIRILFGIGGICATGLIAILVFVFINVNNVNTLTQTDPGLLPTFANTSENHPQVTPQIPSNLTASPTLSIPYGWITYTSPDGHFSSIFPAVAVTNATSVPISAFANVNINTYTSSSVDGGSAYIINDSIYPSAYLPNNASATLTRMVQGNIKANASNKLISQKFVSFLGANAEEYVMQTISNGKIQYIKSLLSPTLRSVYVLQVASSTNSFANYEAFISSFKILQ